MAEQPIDNSPQSNDPKHLVSATISLNGDVPPDVTVKEVIIGESLLNPSVHCAVTLQSLIYPDPTVQGSAIKNWDQYKGQSIKLHIVDNNTAKNQLNDNPREMFIEQTIYRCDNRRFTNLNTGMIEDLTLHSVDNSVLEDARTVLTKSWKCTTPTQIVQEALQKVNGNTDYVEPSGPAKDYVAESIHPFQVIQQQANMALYNGNDPSFLHYMTIQESTGKNLHHFTPLGRLINQTSGYTIYGSDSGITGGKSFSQGFNNAITFTFPCDYDLLSDILNGIGPQGQIQNMVKTFNMASGVFDVFGGLAGAFGSGDAANIFSAITNKGTAAQQNGCESDVETWQLKRQARMGLLEKDKITLRVTVPWSPWLHVGNVFNFQWYNRYDTRQIYGTGDYLIVHLTHNIQFGGYATTTIDCIANTFGGA
jgi:hypothetical protein